MKNSISIAAVLIGSMSFNFALANPCSAQGQAITPSSLVASYSSLAEKSVFAAM